MFAPLTAQQPGVAAGTIPVLTTIPASFDANGEPDDHAFNHVEPIDELPVTATRHRDPHMFALRVEGDSMAPRYNHGDVVICSPTHWQDHGFINGQRYAIRLENGDTTLKRVQNLGGERCRLIPENPDHAERVISCD